MTTIPHRCLCEPLGKLEIAHLFNVKDRTVHVWRDRNELPDWDYDSVNGTPAWEKANLLIWALRTGRASRLSESDRARAEQLLVDLAGDLADEVAGAR